MSNNSSNLKKKILATGIVIAGLGTASVFGIGNIKKVQDCAFQDIQIQLGKNYYCATQAEFNQDYAGFKQRLAAGNLKGVADAGFAQLLINSDNQTAKDDIKNHFLTKYNAQKKEFDGSKFGSDIAVQSLILMELANKKCNGSCQVDPQNLTEGIYNLISQ